MKEGHGVVVASRTTTPTIDIEDPDMIQAFFRNQDPFDGIISAAGDTVFKSLEAMKPVDWATVIRSKLMGQIQLVQGAIACTNPNAKFVLPGGLLGFRPESGTVGVATVNAALDGFVRAAATDLKDGKGISIVHPPMLAETAVEYGRRVGEHHGGYPEANRVASLYLRALMSPESGNSFFVDEFSPDTAKSQEHIEI
jgi:NAD(P)-dependent dehydrogenase (short-subunit alcohol dehydrogenase family)